MQEEIENFIIESPDMFYLGKEKRKYPNDDNYDYYFQSRYGNLSRIYYIQVVYINEIKIYTHIKIKESIRPIKVEMGTLEFQMEIRKFKDYERKKIKEWEMDLKKNLTNYMKEKIRKDPALRVRCLVGKYDVTINNQKIEIFK